MTSTGVVAGRTRGARVLTFAAALIALAFAAPEQSHAQESAATASENQTDPNRTRLFFGPTGRTLGQGEGYAGLYELFFPFVSYGLTDYLTVSGGTPIIPGEMGSIFYLAPAVRVLSTERVDVSAGVLAFFATEDAWDQGSVGIGYVVGTSGDEDASVTVGAGWGFAGSDVSNRPAFMVGGEKRTGRRTKLISENYFGAGMGGGLLSGGIRIFAENLSGDVGLGAMVGEDSFCCVPLLNFVYHFGRAQR